MTEAEIVLNLLASIGSSIYNIATAKTAADRTAAFTKMKADIAEGEAKLAALTTDLAANDAAANAKVDQKFPPITTVVTTTTTVRSDEPTVDLSKPVIAAGDAKDQAPPVLKPVTELK